MRPQYRNGQTHHHGRGRMDFKKFIIKKKIKRQSTTQTRCWNRSNDIDECNFRTTSENRGTLFKNISIFAYCCKSCFAGYTRL